VFAHFCPDCLLSVLHSVPSSTLHSVDQFDRYKQEISVLSSSLTTKVIGNNVLFLLPGLNEHLSESVKSGNLITILGF
jgi:hypothetical protein